MSGSFAAAQRRATQAALAQARGKPPVACRITKEWQSHGMAGIHVFWRTSGGLLVAGYLVDLWGLGLKDGFVGMVSSIEALERRAELQGVGYTSCSLELAQELIYGGLAWARRHGFAVPKDALQALDLLVPPARPPDLSRFGGQDGRPFLIVTDPRDIPERRPPPPRKGR